jgi:WD40 repeat protein
MRVLLACGCLPLFAVGVEAQERLTEIAKEKAHRLYVSALCFSKDGKLAASADGAGSVKVWEVGSRLKEKLSLQATRGKGVTNCVHDVAFSPDGKYLAAATEDQTVWLWDAKSGKVVRRVRGHKDGAKKVIFLGKGEQALSLDKSGSCFIWDVEKEDELVKLGDGYTSSAAASPDGRLVALSVGGKTKTYNVKTGKEVEDLGVSAAFLAFSPDGKHLVKCAGGFGGRITLCDAKTGKEVWSVQLRSRLIRGVQFTADGKRVVSADDVTMRIWDAKDGDALTTFTTVKQSGVSSFVLGLDGRTVLIGNSYGHVILTQIPEQ